MIMKEKTVYALGYFDGVHLGHQALLNACRELAAAKKIRCGAVTFSAHPQQLLTGKAVRLINTREDRKKLLLQQVNTVLELDFTEQLMAMPWQEFIQMLVQEQGASGFVCGSDFRFGKGGEGCAAGLKAFCEGNGLACTVVEQQYVDGIRVSSTHIRKLLEQGDVPSANRFLGHSHMLTGQVAHGKQLGRTIGIPTANLYYPELLLKLPYGVYACRVQAEGKTYAAVTNIGVRPTVSGEGVTVESHLLDFAGDLYGKTIEISFLEFLRPEHKFTNLSELQKQIQKDKYSVENVMQNY